MISNTLFGRPFNAEFSGVAIYMDPEYDMLNVAFTGYTEVSIEDRAGDRQPAEYVNALVSMALTRALGELANRKVPFKTMQQHFTELNDAGTAALQAQGFTVSQFVVRSVEPTESCKKMMALKDQKKAFDAMSPDELRKKMEEAQKQAEAAMAKLSPEEQQKINENVAKQMEEMKRAATMPNGANMLPGHAPLHGGGMRTNGVNAPIADGGVRTDGVNAPVPNHAPHAGGLRTDGSAGLNANRPTAPTMQTAATAPKFCPNCGKPTGGSRFCGECGTRLI